MEKYYYISHPHFSHPLLYKVFYLILDFQVFLQLLLFFRLISRLRRIHYKFNIDIYFYTNKF